MRRRRELHALALELFTNRIESLHPYAEMRNADLIRFDRSAARRGSQWRDQCDHWRFFAHAVWPGTRLSVAQDSDPILAVMAFRDSTFVLGAAEFGDFLRDLKTEQVTIEMQRAVVISHPERHMRQTSWVHDNPPVIVGYSLRSWLFPFEVMHTLSQHRFPTSRVQFPGRPPFLTCSSSDRSDASQNEAYTALISAVVRGSSSVAFEPIWFIT